MKLFSEMDQIHTSEQWIQDTLTLCNSEGEKPVKISNKGKEKNRRVRRRLYPVLIAAVATLIVVPFSVVAANHFMLVVSNKDGAEVVVNHGTIAIEDIVPMKVAVSYIPEGMTKYDKGPKYYYEQTPNQGGLSLRLWKMDAETEKFEFPVKNAVSSEEMKINGYEAVLIQKEKNTDQNLAFSREMFIYYADKGYVIQIYIGDDMSEDEVVKFATGLSLVQTEDGNTDDINGTWDSYIQSKNKEYLTKTTEDTYKNVAKVGSIIDKTEFNEMYSIGKPINCIGSVDTSMQLTVEDVSMQKNFNGITTDCIGRPTDFSEYLNANGQLVDDEFSVVIIHMHYKNISDTKQKYGYCVSPYIEALDEENDQYKICATTVEADRNSILYTLGFGKWAFSFYSDTPGNHNGVEALDAGQEANVQLAFIVKDEYLQSMFLVQNATGYDIISQNQYVDIRQKK